MYASIFILLLCFFFSVEIYFFHLRNNFLFYGVLNG